MVALGFKESMIEEWVETTSFRPSNKLLITKLFSSILDRTPIDPKLWGAITCPVLVIHGGKLSQDNLSQVVNLSPFAANDVACPEEVAREIYNKMSCSPKELHIVADAPHFLSWTHALSVNALLANFLDSITGVNSRQVVSKLTERKNNFIAEFSG